MIQIGQKVRDRVTSFTGTVTGKAEYITGCTQFLVQPNKLTDDGQIVSGHWIDVDRLEIVEADKLVLGPITANGPDLAAPIK